MSLHLIRRQQRERRPSRITSLGSNLVRPSTVVVPAAFPVSFYRADVPPCFEAAMPGSLASPFLLVPARSLEDFHKWWSLQASSMPWDIS